MTIVAAFFAGVVTTVMSRRVSRWLRREASDATMRQGEM